MDFFSPIWENIIGFLSLGGPVVSLLLLLSVFAFAICLSKGLQFHGQQVGKISRVDAILDKWRIGERTGAIDLAHSSKGAAPKAVLAAMGVLHHYPEQANRVEEEVQRIATQDLHDLQRGFRSLDAVVQIAPLLGLFGTVLGMIEAFQTLQGAGSAVDPAQLAGGIWVALLTTAVGLAIAIPVSLIMTWFETRIEDERVGIEVAVSELLSIHKSDAFNALHGGEVSLSDEASNPSSLLDNIEGTTVGAT